MARTIDTIQTDIKNNVRTYTSLNAFKFPEDGGSQVSVFNLIIYIVAVSIYAFEVILDQMKSDITNIANSAPAGNASWLRNQILKFQYGDIIQLINYVPTYNPINTVKQIITQCSIKDNYDGSISIKVAKGTTTPYLPLATAELAALQDYYYGTATTQGIGFAGVRANFISLNPDRIEIVATVYYYGQYVGATVKTNVIAAINTFLSTFSGTAFDGRVFMIKLVDAIQLVQGVSRIKLFNVNARDASTAYGAGLVVDIQGYYDTVAGHIINEDTTLHTLNDTLTMTIEALP